jgi:hypothetical protein
MKTEGRSAMSWVAPSPASYVGQSVGNGQCVAYVQVAAHAPVTAEWTQGQLVKGNDISQGTAIATFDPDGTYGNHTDGRSHAAIFHEETSTGLLVWDQWVQPAGVHKVAPRVISFNDQDGLACDNGNVFYVIEHA